MWEMLLPSCGFFLGCVGSSLLSVCFSPVVMCALLITAASLAEHRLQVHRLSNRSAQTLGCSGGSVVMAPGLWSTGSTVLAHRLLLALRYVGSSRIRD